MRILTDRKTENCGAREHHTFQLYLAIEDIDHTKSNSKSPQTNGVCERFHLNMQDEFFAIAFRKNIYSSIDELQADVDVWLDYYNNHRPHSGKYSFGKTPMQTWEDSLHMAKEKLLNNQFQKILSLSLSDKTGTSTGGDQQVRDNLTDWNCHGASKSPLLTWIIPGVHASENAFLR